MQLRDLFHKPTTHAIGGLDFAVSKIAFEQFDDAITLGTWASTLDATTFSPAQLAGLRTSTPERAALCRLLAGCLAVAPPPSTDEHQRPITLQPSDVEAMPVVMLAEAIAIVLSVNADFFFQSLPNFLATANRIRSIGSALLSNWSAPATSLTT